jgi:hypothetical protein
MQVFQRRLIDTAQQQASMQDVILKNKLRIGAGGVPLTPVDVQNYSYVGSLTNIAAVAGIGNQSNIQIQGDSDFVAVYLSGLVFDHGTGDQIVNPFCELQITDNTSQRPMFSDPVLFSLVCGNGGFPYIFQEPRLFTANTQILFTYYNLLTIAGTATDMQISFSGYRVFY